MENWDVWDLKVMSALVLGISISYTTLLNTSGDELIWKILLGVSTLLFIIMLLKDGGMKNE